MKFITLTALVATIQAQIVCNDQNFGDLCPEGACCGYLQPPQGENTRGCSTSDQGGAEEYSGDDVFTCDEPVVEEEGATKIALGATALLAAIQFYMA